MVPDDSKTCLGMEYFCNEEEALWKMPDSELIELASKEVVRLNLGVRLEDIQDGCVIRQRKAYPVYDGSYRKHLKVLQDYLATFENLQTVGRNGMHRYNNQDHSMLTALLAARNALGEQHDLWNVNIERSYHESFTDADWQKRQRSQPLQAILKSKILDQTQSSASVHSKYVHKKSHEQKLAAATHSLPVLSLQAKRKQPSKAKAVENTPENLSN